MAQQVKQDRPSRRVQAARRPPTVRRQRPAAPPFRYGFQPKAFYTPGEIAEILGVSSQTVLDWIHKDRLGAVQLSERVYRIPLGGLLIHLGEPPRVTRSIGRYRRRDDLRDERVLAREHAIDLKSR